MKSISARFWQSLHRVNADQLALHGYLAPERDASATNPRTAAEPAQPLANRSLINRTMVTAAKLNAGCC